ncbi:MAG: hypothetical protein ACUVXD_12525, partial [Thermodesulfobacteriota bacterium]
PRDSGQAHRVVQRLEREIFHVGHRLYVLNSSRGIRTNLRCCLLDFLRRGNPWTMSQGLVRDGDWARLTEPGPSEM